MAWRFLFREFCLLWRHRLPTNNFAWSKTLAWHKRGLSYKSQKPTVGVKAACSAPALGHLPSRRHARFQLECLNSPLLALSPRPSDQCGPANTHGLHFQEAGKKKQSLSGALNTAAKNYCAQSESFPFLLHKDRLAQIPLSWISSPS